MNFDKAVKYLTETNALFFVEEKKFEGITYKVMPNIPKNLIELVDYAKTMLLGKTYIIHEKERLTFDEFIKFTDNIAYNLITKYKIKKGDRIAIAMKNCPQYLICLIGIIKAGGIAVLLNAWWTKQELKYGFDHSGVKLAFLDYQRYSRIRDLLSIEKLPLVLVGNGKEKYVAINCDEYQNLILTNKSQTGFLYPKIEESEVFAIIYSSGSTGKPKGVVLTHIGALHAIFSWKMFIEVSKLTSKKAISNLTIEPAILCATPLFHVTASHPTFLLSMAIGAKLVLMNKWDPVIALNLIKREKITRFLGVPTMTADMAKANQTLGIEVPTLQYLGSGGAKRPESQVRDQAAAFPNASLASGWGMTETNALGLGVIGEDYLNKPHSTGRLYPPIQEMQIVDDTGRGLPNGVAGELCVKSIANMKGYLNDPSETKKVLQDGWLRTGDQAISDEEGFVTIIGRFKDIIIRGGENISCLEVENILYAYPKIHEASVFSVPDERLGEQVGALIYPHPETDFNLKDLMEFITKKLAKFKHPKYFWLSSELLPKGGTDKIDRNLIRRFCIKGDKFTVLN